MSVSQGVAGRGGCASPGHDGGGHPGEWGRSPLRELQRRAPPQVVSGCLSSLVSVWEMETGRRTAEFSVSGDQQVELTTMCLDESERRLLTGLRDGTLKMWSYTTGECLLVFPNPDRLEVGPLCQLGPGCRLSRKARRSQPWGALRFRPPFKAVRIDRLPSCLPEPLCSRP